MNNLHSAFHVKNLLQLNIFSLHFIIKNVKDLFNGIPADKIIYFLKEIGLFNKL